MLIDTIDILQFTGYDMGNNIISLTASKYNLFPSDGAQIRVERTEFLYGKYFMFFEIILIS